MANIRGDKLQADINWNLHQDISVLIILLVRPLNLNRDLIIPIVVFLFWELEAEVITKK